MTLAGCDSGDTVPRVVPKPPPAAATPPPLDLDAGAPPPAAAAWTDEHTARVHASCTGCHLLPPPDALPRSRWRETIASMGSMPVPAGLPPLTADDGRLALAYYERHAPEVLAFQPQAPAPAASPRFRVEHFTPRGLEKERVPAVSHVTAVHLSDPDRWDLLVSEMRTSSVTLLRPWADPARRELQLVRNRLNYPAFTQLVDVDGDGRVDLLTAAMGGMNPTNERKGAVLLARQAVDRPGFHAARPLSAPLGRVAALACADLDADGDQDIVAAAFGLHGPGELVLLRNRSAGDPQGGGAALQREQFSVERLDDRDGYLAVEIWDADGDGRLDIVTLLAQEHEEVVIFQQGATGAFSARIVHKAPHPGWGYSSLCSVPSRVAPAAGAPRRDLVVTNGDTLDNDQLKPYHGVAWFENHGGFRFAEHRVGPLQGCERATTADIDGDGDLDIVAVSFLPHLPAELWKSQDLESVVWFEQVVEGQRVTWRRHVIERHLCIHAAVSAQDFNGDGKVDIAVGNFVWMLDDNRPALRSDYLTLFTQQ